MDIIIDDLGNVWSPNGALPPAPKLGPGALSGRQINASRRYVHVRIDDEKRLIGASLRLGTTPITQACFERLLWILVWKKVERAVIDYRGDRAEPELLTLSKDIVARLEEISGMALIPSFRLERLALGRLEERGRLSVLDEELRVWRRAHGQLSRRALNAEIGAINSRRMVIRVSGLRLQMLAVSDVSLTYRPCERMRMLGQDVELQPDTVYGESLAETFREFALNDANQPGLQEVDAVITKTDGRLVRVRYERLLLPWKSRGGERWITSQPLLRMRREMLD
jgi:hypothetical protein